MTIATALRFYDIAVFIHIASVVIAFGVIFVYPLIVPFTLRQAPDKLGWVHRLQGVIGQRIITLAGALILISGLYLVLSDDGRFSFDDDWWTGFGLVAILVILGLGGAYFGPRERRLAELAERDAGTPSAEYRGVLRQWWIVAVATMTLVLVTILFMVLGARGVFT
jgi:Predicted integral membrane protein (DUF2269)